MENSKEAKKNNSLKLFVPAFIFSFLLFWGINFLQKTLEKIFFDYISQPYKEIHYIAIPQELKKTKPEIDARAVISFEVGKNGGSRILFKKNAEQPFPIASITKLMTALVVFENDGEKSYDMDKRMVVSKLAASQEDIPIFGNLKSGENFSVEEFLNFMLVYSSNDAAWALSEKEGTGKFIERMNEKTKELGVINTGFINPTGIDPDPLKYSPENVESFNYSTAKDLALISRYILEKYPSVFEITAKESLYSVPNGIKEVELKEGQKLIGGKTGYTDEAGGCMLLIVEKENGSKVVNVVLGASSSESRVEEIQKIINWL